MGTFLTVDIGAYPSRLNFQSANPDWHLCDGNPCTIPGSVYSGVVIDMRNKVLQGWGGVAFNGTDYTPAIGTSGANTVALIHENIP